MLRLTLAQMRRSLGRLSAAAVAIAIGSAFLAATLIAGGVITRTGYDALTATYAQADVVIRGQMTAVERSEVRHDPQVAATAVLAPVTLEVRHDGRVRAQNLITAPSDPRLGSLTLAKGAAPVTAGEIALPPETATALRVGVGDSVEVAPLGSAGDGASAFRVVGITADRPTPGRSPAAPV